MKIAKKGNNCYHITTRDFSVMLRIVTKEELLLITITEKLTVTHSSTFTIGNLVDVNKRFRAYEIEEVFHDIHFSIEKEDFTLLKSDKDQFLFSYHLGSQKITFHINPVSSSKDLKRLSFVTPSKSLSEIELQEENERLTNIILNLRKKNEELEKIIEEKDVDLYSSHDTLLPKRRKKKSKTLEGSQKQAKLLKSAKPLKNSSKHLDEDSSPIHVNQATPKNSLKKMELESSKIFHNNSVNTLCSLKDGRLVSGSDDDKIIVYSLEKFESEMTLVGHSSNIHSVSLLNNGSLISASSDTKIKIWEISELKYKCTHTLKGHIRGVLKAMQLTRGRIGSCSDDKTIKIWDDTTYECIKTLHGHTDYVWSFIELKNHNFIVSANGESDNTVRFWNNKTYHLEKVIESVKCCNNNSLVEIASQKILVGGRSRVVVIDSGSCEVCNVIAMKDEGSVLSFLELSEGIVLFGMSKGKLIHYDMNEAKMLGWRDSIHSRGVKGMMIWNKSRLITCSEDKSVKVWK